MQGVELDSLPFHTFRHIRQLFNTQLINKSVLLNVPHEGPIWDDVLWEEHGHSITQVFGEITNNIEAWGE